MDRVDEGEAYDGEVSERQLERSQEGLVAQVRQARRHSVEVRERAVTICRRAEEVSQGLTSAGAPAGAPSLGCRLLRADPDLLDSLAPEERRAALEHCVVETIAVPHNSTQLPHLRPGQTAGAIGLLILEGLLLRRVGVQGRFSAELLGPGDLLQPWLDTPQDDFGSVQQQLRWRVAEPLRLAVLDRAAAHRLSRFPSLGSALTTRALTRANAAMLQMAIVHHPRTETRVHMLLWHLADRWGRVSRDGVTLPLRLPHATIGELVAARRPSVTVALKELAARDLVRRLDRGWLLRGMPPAGAAA